MRLAKRAAASLGSSQLKQISIALQSYSAKYNSFPPAYIADADGKPMHSWRVLLLPFLDRNELFSNTNSTSVGRPNNIASCTIRF